MSQSANRPLERAFKNSDDLPNKKKKSLGKVICVLIVAPLFVTVIGGLTVEWLKPTENGNSRQFPPTTGTVPMQMNPIAQGTPYTGGYATLTVHREKTFWDSSSTMSRIIAGGVAKMELSINGVSKGSIDMDETKSYSFKLANDGENQLHLKVTSPDRFGPPEVNENSFSFTVQPGGTVKVEVANVVGKPEATFK